MNKLDCTNDTNNFDVNSIVSCKEYVALKKMELKEKIDSSNAPTLLIIKVGEDNASNVYVNGKKKDCAEVGIECMIRTYPDTVTEDDIIGSVRYYSSLNCINGIIVQLPLPKHINPDKIAEAIPAKKDVDGFRRDSLFDCCTPKGIIDWLEYNNYNFVGKDVVVLGRSKIVGKPLTNMLIDRGATVTCCNSHTNNTGNYTEYADLVISAVGKAKHFGCNDVSAFCNVVVDIGINRDENGKLCGDFDPDGFNESLLKVYLTPVPGGVGLLTRLALLQNVVKAHEMVKEMEAI